MNKTVLLAVATLCGCGFMVDDAEAIRAAETMGMSKVRVVERHDLAPAWFGCDQSDSAGFEIYATNAAGKSVSAVVCCGVLLKGCTVRSR